jgi:Acyl-CoA dehydrogenase, N-terminal domain
MLPTAPRGRQRHGLTAGEKQDPIGFAVALLNRIAQTSALDRFGPFGWDLRKPTERAVFEATRSGFRTLGAVNRQFARQGGSRGTRNGEPTRVPSAASAGMFDLTPTDDEQMLVDVVREFAAEVVRPVAAEADDLAQAPEPVLKAGLEIGLPTLGVPEELGGISAERTAMAGTLVAEALAHGDLGLAVATLAPGA